MEAFPYKYLTYAYNILTDQGYDAFRRCVKRVTMPTEDIERVLNKHAYHTNPEFRKKIARICKNITNETGIDFEKLL